MPLSDFHPAVAGWFRRTLQCGAPKAEKTAQCEQLRWELQNFERVRIEPTGPSSARYVIYWKSEPTHRVVYAEYPGDITRELVEARVPYDVKPR